MTVFSVGDLPRLGLEPGTIGQQTIALTVQPFNAQTPRQHGAVMYMRSYRGFLIDCFSTDSLSTDKMSNGKIGEKEESGERTECQNQKIKNENNDSQNIYIFFGFYFV